MPFQSPEWIAVPAALLLALAVTPGVGRLARHYGAVAQPRADRWHTKPTALLGGIAIFLAVVIPLFGFGLLGSKDIGWFSGCVIMFVFGLVDDVRRIKPLLKLVGQILAAAAVFLAGARLTWTGIVVADYAITVFWLMGVTNALNLIDNMDGLAAGIAAIAAGFFAVYFVFARQTSAAITVAILTAALVGFLIYNFNPASIFMGDSGSQFIGFYLASAALSIPPDGDEYKGLTSLAPILILAVPIFDTSFVTITRTMSGRPISQGGRDHTSHCLVAIGFSERAAVVMLYLVSTTTGLAALIVGRLPPLGGFLVAVGIGFGLTCFGNTLIRLRNKDAKSSELMT